MWAFLGLSVVDLFHWKNDPWVAFHQSSLYQWNPHFCVWLQGSRRSHHHSMVATDLVYISVETKRAFVKIAPAADYLGHVSWVDLSCMREMCEPQWLQWCFSQSQVHCCWLINNGLFILELFLLADALKHSKAVCKWRMPSLFIQLLLFYLMCWYLGKISWISSHK